MPLLQSLRAWFGGSKATHHYDEAAALLQRAWQEADDPTAANWSNPQMRVKRRRHVPCLNKMVHYS
jgi:hypothetical protein